MKIVVKTKNHDIDWNLPLSVGLSPMAAGKLAALARRRGVALTDGQARQLCQSLKDYRRSHGEWVAVDVERADGSRVFIEL